ncbi:MAG: ABC transporter permease [Alkalinema sp. RL_2_19]|nr:ABC transporter permease [Alkalinema sp. RL_2_19]
MLRSLTKLDYLLRETGLGFMRGGWMNWAAISTVTVLLFLMGSSLQASWQVERLVNQFGNQLEVSVYLDTGVDSQTLKPVVQKFPEVASVQAITKEEAWKSLIKELGDANLEDSLKNLGGNPLVDEMRVKAINSQSVDPLAQKLRKIKGIGSVQYISEAVQRIAQLNEGLRMTGFAITGFLALSAIAVISTTIRLIALARSDELEIMRLVGATRAWIYLPFLFQGIIFGGVGAWVAWLLIQLVQKSLLNMLKDQPELIQAVTISSSASWTEPLLLPLILMGCGGLIGTIGSILAVRSVKA